MLQRLVAAGTLTTSDVLYVGRRDSVEARIAGELGVPFAGIQVHGLRGMERRTQAQSVREMLSAESAAAGFMAQFQPNVVLATGGYVSVPVMLAAWRKKIPIIIELPDLEPGWAIRATWRLSRQVAVSFAQVLVHFARGRAAVTGYPVRAEFYTATRSEAIAHFQLEPTVPVVTVFGGSQGAHALNETVKRNLSELVRGAQVLHISGTKDAAELAAHRAQLGAHAERYHLFDYLTEDMPLALAAADVVVARAGAATLGEFPAVGAPSILVPGLFAAGHQQANADFLAAHGAALVLSEASLPNTLPNTLRGLLEDKGRLAAMRAAAKQLDQPLAAERIGALLREAAG